MGTAQGDEKRNLSLEALFQVTHNELEHISRHGDDEEDEKAKQLVEREEITNDEEEIQSKEKRRERTLN